ncbi:MAG TPA: 16S rRNA (adenine(1518)-N(6)/adenine(1519)-N(6))-dimethyltransferase RsmA [Anaerolineales bacterium]|nr:16S rRNA (adenine(1518)-N(6)/adenine(1519)-N(6))-dimethyltransferase RsmA [Anaerolineales bacterium]
MDHSLKPSRTNPPGPPLPPGGPLDVPGLLRRHHLRPDKGLGQNFLLDETALRRIVMAAEILPQHDILEIGPGLGSLTRHLAAAARQVVAVELDSDLFGPLEEVLGGMPNVHLVQGDILALNPVELMPAPGYLVVANIPYYITSALLRHLLETERPPLRMVLTVQREVAQRICALPGDLSLLALSVQVYGRPSIAAHIPAGAFYPPPKVDSAVVRIDLFDTPAIPVALLEDFFQLIKAGFSQKRKTLRNSISGGLKWSPARAAELLSAAGIDPQRRAETLSLSEWGQLTQAYQLNPNDTASSLPPA